VPVDGRCECLALVFWHWSMAIRSTGSSSLLPSFKHNEQPCNNSTMFEIGRTPIHETKPLRT
jgi:hypothetical protein